MTFNHYSSLIMWLPPYLKLELTKINEHPSLPSGDGCEDRYFLKFFFEDKYSNRQIRIPHHKFFPESLSCCCGNI